MHMIFPFLSFFFTFLFISMRNIDSRIHFTWLYFPFSYAIFFFLFSLIFYFHSMSWLEYDACLSIIKAIIVLRKSHFKCEEFFLSLAFFVWFIYKSWRIELLFLPNPECGNENGVNKIVYLCVRLSQM